MSDTPEYILKAGVTISDDILLWGPNMVAITVRDEQGIYRGSMERALYERAFVPLDRQALTKQLEEIIIEAAECTSYEVHRPGTKPTPECIGYEEVIVPLVKKALVLFGLENKESN